MRSDAVFKGTQQAPHRSLFNALGLTEEEMNRPLIGIVSSYNEIVPGHMNLDKIVEAVKLGVAMGGVGSDIAVDAADIALVDDEVKELPHLIALSHRMMTTIKLNMTFSMALNFAAIILAIIGTLNPVVGALVHNAGSVLVITSSAFLLNWKKK